MNNNNNQLDLSKRNLLKSIDIDTAITMKKVMFCYVPEE